MTAQTGPYVGNQTPEGLINFSLGQPSPRMLPLDEIAQGAASLGGADPLVLQYGATQGFVGFREALAGFLSQRYGAEVRAEQLALSGAVSLSLGLLADVFGRRRGLVACEDPTYFLARGIFDSAGLRSFGVPIDDEGLNVEALRARIEGGEVPDFVYLIPTFQNPSGSVMSEARRGALLALAEAHDFVVIADEPYNLLHFEGARAPLPLAMHPAAGERVVSVSSFTKILAPGLRTGWWQASPAMLERALGHGVLRSGGNLNPVMAQMLLPLIEGGFLARNVDATRELLAARCAAMCEAIRSELPGARFVAPAGGYFLWVDFGAGVDARALRRAAKAHGVAFTEGKRCAVDAEFPSTARLSFAFYEVDEIREGVARIAAALAGLS